MHVLLANGRPDSWKAIRQLLEQHHAITIVGEVPNFSTMVRLIEKGCVDLVLLDWELPGIQPQILVDFLERICPKLRVLVIADSPEVEEAARRAGVDVFAGGRDPFESLLTSLLIAQDIQANSL